MRVVARSHLQRVAHGGGGGRGGAAPGGRAGRGARERAARSLLLSKRRSFEEDVVKGLLKPPLPAMWREASTGVPEPPGTDAAAMGHVSEADLGP
jgi:hypothetical protein